MTEEKKKNVEIEKPERRPGFKPNKEKITEPTFPPGEDDLTLPRESPIIKPTKPDTNHPQPNEIPKTY